MRKFFAVILSFILIQYSFAQAPQSWTSAEMYQAIRKLNVLGTVLYVAAHPDDENTRLISYLSKDRLYRTGYLSLTRGDGGQNLIGNEQGIELGLIRTQELLAARRIDGGEQFFSRAYDFGYSKTPAETFTKWDKDKILSDVVYVIRKFQPDVIITRFPTTGEGGHGHHTASAILANEAFTAAADPAKFPEQLKYVKVWQAKRVLWNSFNFGGTNLTSNDQFKVDVGGYNPLLGKSYGEIAAESRSQHKSQGFGVPAGRGEALEYFKTTGGPAPVNDLMDGVDLTWNKIEGGGRIAQMVDDISKSFDFLNPDKSIKSLVQLHKMLNELSVDEKYSSWKYQKLNELKEIIAQCSGLFMDATTSEQFAVKTDSVRIFFSFNNRLGVDATLQKVSIVASKPVDSVFNRPLLKNRNLNYSQVFYVNPSTVTTQPYWLANKMEEGYFVVKDQTSIGQPDVDPSYFLSVSLLIENTPFNYVYPVWYKFTDPVKGELYEPLVVLPALTIAPDENVKITVGKNNFEGTLNVTSKKKNVSAAVTNMGTAIEDKYFIEFEPSRVSFTEKNTSVNVNYKVQATKDNDYNFSLTDDDSRFPYYFEEGRQIKYDHIPYINYFKPAIVTNKKVNLKIYGKKIGYIVGAGDKVPEALEQMGYDVTLLTDKELSRNNLNQFDAIITGVRSHNTNEWMNKHYDKLMKYVHEGGNLIVQYNTSSNIGPVKAKMGPYNFNISRTRITDENAPVTFVKPDHKALNFPNKITQEDFTGWVQERSIYHASDWDKEKFETIISMNDPGEKAEEGSLIIAKHGKGYFTYTGIVFFRELPAGVPGAYRLLANLIALNAKKAF